MDIDPPQASSVSDLPQAPLDPPRRTLVLDLDETLIHTALGTGQECWVTHQRPFAIEFLELMSRHYEIVVFTAGLENYAGPIIDQLDRHGSVTHRLYRGSCAIMSGADKRPLYAKDLMLLGRDLTSTIIVDNSPESYFLQPENAIPIKPFFGDVHDKELYTLADFLMHLVDVDVADVRTVIRKCHERGKFRARKSDGVSRGYSSSCRSEMIDADHVVDNHVRADCNKSEEHKHVIRSNATITTNTNTNNNNIENQVFHSERNAFSHTINSHQNLGPGLHSTTQSTSPASISPRTTPVKPHTHTSMECKPTSSTHNTTQVYPTLRTTPNKSHAQANTACAPTSPMPSCSSSKAAPAKAVDSSAVTHAPTNIVAGTKPSQLAGKANARSHTSGMNATSASLMQVLVTSTGLAGNRGGTDDGGNTISACTSHDDGTLKACITFLDAARRALVREGDNAVYPGIQTSTVVSTISTTSVLSCSPQDVIGLTNSAQTYGIQPATVVSTLRHPPPTHATTTTVLSSFPQNVVCLTTSAQSGTSIQTSLTSPITASVLWTPRREQQWSNINMTDFSSVESEKRVHTYSLPYIQRSSKARALREGYSATCVSGVDRHGQSGQNCERMCLLLSNQGNVGANVSRLKDGFKIDQREHTMYSRPNSSHVPFRTEADLFESAQMWRTDERIQTVGTRLENSLENSVENSPENMQSLRIEPYTYAAAARLGLRGGPRQVSFSVQ
jgi:Dullard-like phosphatase family protein